MWFFFFAKEKEILKMKNKKSCLKIGVIRKWRHILRKNKYVLCFRAFLMSELYCVCQEIGFVETP